MDDGLMVALARVRRAFAGYRHRPGSFLDAPTFLDAVAATGEDVGRYLDIWSDTSGSAADRHLADAVNGFNVASRQSGTLEQMAARRRAGLAPPRVRARPRVDLGR